IAKASASPRSTSETSSSSAKSAYCFPWRVMPAPVTPREGTRSTPLPCLSNPMGKKPLPAAAFRLDLPLSPDEEILGVYGEHHPHVAVGVASLHDAHRPVYAVCPHPHPEAGGPFAHLQGDLYHLSLPSREGNMSAQPPDVAWRDMAARRAHARERSL